MFALMLILSLQTGDYADPVMIPKFSGVACKDRASSETMIDLYVEHTDEGLRMVKRMVTQTHQCAQALYGFPPYVVYRGKGAWGPSGPGEVVGLAPRPDLPPLIYTIMQPRMNEI